MGLPGKMCPWCSRGTALIGITDCFLIGSEACSTARNSCLVLSTWSKPWLERTQRTEGGAHNYCSAKRTYCQVCCKMPSSAGDLAISLTSTQQLQLPAQEKVIHSGVHGTGSHKAPPSTEAPLDGCCGKSVFFAAMATGGLPMLLQAVLVGFSGL
jgi:hypothetical protein